MRLPPDIGKTPLHDFGNVQGFLQEVDEELRCTSSTHRAPRPGPTAQINLQRAPDLSPARPRPTASTGPPCCPPAARSLRLDARVANAKAT